MRTPNSQAGKLFRKSAVFWWSFWSFFFIGTSVQAFENDWYIWEEDSQYLFIDTDTTWTAAENRVVDRWVVIRNNATLKVEKGATIKFARETEDYAPVIIVENGKIVAEGTEKEPIVFTSDQNDSGFSFYFNSPNGQESFFRYVTIEKAGGEYERIYDDSAVPIGWWRNWLFPQALAIEKISVELTYPIHYYQGQVRFENCTFNNSRSEVEIRQEDLVLSEANYEKHFLRVINSNFIAFKDQAVLDSELGCDFEHMDLERIDPVCWERTWLKNNYYATASGPYLLWDDSLEDYLWEKRRAGDETPCLTGCQPGHKSVFGQLVNVDGHRQKSLIADPVIIIPGITGSEIDPTTGQWVLDPILHTYDDLWESLEASGFEEEKNLWAFPYQWRQKNEISAGELKQKIEAVKTATGARKVDLVAHSMGGLVARYYLESDGTNEAGLLFGNDVDQLITLGTPHHGSPAAYLQWEAGEGYFGFWEMLAKYHFFNEAKHSGYPDIFNYIRNEVPSVKQLLPDSADYLMGINGFSPGYPENEFLRELNRSEKWEKLLQETRLFKIAGYKETADDTLTSLKLTTSSKAGLWEDGMPENYYSNKTGFVYGAGDETVPLFSARGPAGGAGKTINATHRYLPQAAQCVVADALGAGGCVKKEHWNFPNLLYFNVFSPVDIQVVAPDGRRVGKDFVSGQLLNEIPGAFYSGFATENEFISVPVLADGAGEYQLLTQGVASTETVRDFRVEVNLLNEEETEKNLTLAGTAQPGEEKTEKILVSASGELSGDQPISAQALEEKFALWWQERKISKKVFREFRDDLRYLTRWEKIKERVANQPGVRAKVVARKKAGYLAQLRQIQKRVRKYQKWWRSEILAELQTDLQKLAEKEE